MPQSAQASEKTTQRAGRAQGKRGRRALGGRGTHQGGSPPETGCARPPGRLQVLLVNNDIHAVVFVVLVAALLALRARALVLECRLFGNSRIAAQAHVGCHGLACGRPAVERRVLVVLDCRHFQGSAQQDGLFETDLRLINLNLRKREVEEPHTPAPARMWHPERTQMLDEVDEDAQNAALEVR